MKMNSTTVRIINYLSRFFSLLSPKLSAVFLERLFLKTKRRPLPEHEKKWLSSARKEVLTFDKHRKFVVYSWGEGPVMLLVHGWCGRAGQMGIFAEPLLKQGFRVVTFDAVAHGAADGKLTGMPEMAKAIGIVAKKYGPIKGVIAHSMGSTATTLALTQGLDAERLVYIGPPNDPGGYLFIAAKYLGFSHKVANLTQARIEKRFSFAFQDTQGVFLAKRLKQPLLVIHDLGDKEVPYKDGARLVENWSGSCLMSTQGLGHYRTLKDEKVVKAACDFVCDDYESQYWDLKADWEQKKAG